MLETESELEIFQKTEKAEVKLEEIKSKKLEEPSIGLSYGQSVGLKDDLDDDIGQ